MRLYSWYFFEIFIRPKTSVTILNPNHYYKINATLTWYWTSSRYGYCRWELPLRRRGWKGFGWTLPLSTCSHTLVQPATSLLYLLLESVQTIVQGKTKHHRNHCHHHQNHDNLKLIIDGHIGLVVPVLEGDVKAVAALGGELVKLVQTQPQLPCNKSSPNSVPQFLLKFWSCRLSMSNLYFLVWGTPKNWLWCCWILASWFESCFVIGEILVEIVGNISDIFPLQHHHRTWACLKLA